jgi:hypothetical protein
VFFILFYFLWGEGDALVQNYSNWPVLSNFGLSQPVQTNSGPVLIGSGLVLTGSGPVQTKTNQFRLRGWFQQEASQNQYNQPVLPFPVQF